MIYIRELFASTNTGINFDKYEDIQVEASGYKCPEHIENFSDIRFSPIIQENIKVSFKLYIIVDVLIACSIYETNSSTEVFYSCHII